MRSESKWENGYVDIESKENLRKCYQFVYINNFENGLE
jgi:hypothetical protein